MKDIVVDRIPVESVYPLRQAILRPDKPFDFSIYPSDRETTTLHLGAFNEGQLVGIASLYHESPSEAADPGAWRLRDMGVLEPLRRQGYGRALLHACLAHIINSGDDLLWCNVRASAVPFYLAHDFQMREESFEMPGFGPRFFMWRKVNLNH